MDFFESQDIARRKSRVLVAYFVLALVGIVAAIYVVVLGGHWWMMQSSASDSGYAAGVAAEGWHWWEPELLLWTGVVTLGVIFLGSGFKTMQLSAGGSVVAKDLGGRRVDPETRDLDERRLINVVEEMAIASGIPVPEIYVLEDEDSINAFAAGRDTSNAVVGVTRGCVKMLSRDELQGVIAHEFSHILNGDMRLNLRLLGLVFGILMVSIIGRMFLRGAAHSREKGALPLLAFGLAVFLIGSIGIFFAKMIKAAVSRQREYLADASAVQFTRNPDGLGGALQKIGGLSYGSRIQSPRAEEASHMFFANGTGFSAMFATHPPLKDRIGRIMPSWDGKFPKVKLPEISASWTGKEPEPAEKKKRGVLQRGAVMGLSAEEAVGSLGRLQPEQVVEARRIHEELPEEWATAVHHQAGAQSLMFALLLAQDDNLRGQELGFLRESTDETTYKGTLRFHEEIGDLHSSRKLALIDLAIPALRRLNVDEYDRFSAILTRLMESDQKIDLFEFTLQKIVRRHLDLYFRRMPPPRIRFRHLGQLADEASVLLSTMGYLGHRESARDAEHAFRVGAVELESDMGGQKLTLRAPEECGLPDIDAALDRFDQATPLVKKRLLYGCARAVLADEKIESDEAELLRGIADTIGVPIPPFVRQAEMDAA